MQIIDAGEEHLPGILAIYNEVTANSANIYRDDLSSMEERAAWFADRKAGGYPVLVAVDDAGAVLGMGSFGIFRGAFNGYRHSVEHTVLVEASARGKGLGRALLTALEARAVAQGRHVMVGAIDGDNIGSIRLHEKLGFSETARIPECGAKFGRWLTVVFMSKILDDRAAPPAD